MRAVAIVAEVKEERICLISCDVLMLTRDVLDGKGMEDGISLRFWLRKEEKVGKKDGQLIAWIFGHFTHKYWDPNGRCTPPWFLWAIGAGAEEEIGGVGLPPFGAAGSTHNMRLTTEEMIGFIKKAVKEAFNSALEHLMDNVKAIRGR